jgi:hypothetical protein
MVYFTALMHSHIFRTRIFQACQPYSHFLYAHFPCVSIVGLPALSVSAYSVPAMSRLSILVLTFSVLAYSVLAFSVLTKELAISSIRRPILALSALPLQVVAWIHHSFVKLRRVLTDFDGYASLSCLYTK